MTRGWDSTGSGWAALRMAVWVVVGVIAPMACGDGPVAAPPEAAIDLRAPWATATPASVGIDAERLADAVDRARSLSPLRSLLVVRSGRLVEEVYGPGITGDMPVDVRSVTKSVVSLLVGLALERGALASVDQPITRWIAPAPGSSAPSDLDEVTIRHLLTMTGGWAWAESGPEAVATYNDWITSGDPVGHLLARPLVDPPGTHFAYNSAAAHLLAVILEAATGVPLPEFAAAELFDPLGIDEVAWEPLGESVNGGAGLDLRPRDLARLGQLVLQRGWSGHRRLVPAAWIDAATSPRSPWTVEAGGLDAASYGYLWWLDRTREAVLAWGHGGQFIYVAPTRDLVVVVTTDWRATASAGGAAALEAAVLDLIVDGIVPAVL